MAQPAKNITIPIDGSKNSLRSIEYLDLMFGPEHDLKVSLCYILPSIPLIFEDDISLSREDRARLRALEHKNLQAAEKILAEAKALMVEKGFAEEKIHTAHKKKVSSIPKDIFRHADAGKSDAILATRRGKTEVKDLFMGEVCRNLVEYCQEMPIWILGGHVKSKNVLVAVDSSENALRAVDHAGFMISGTNARVTLFHVIKTLGGFFPSEVLKEAGDLEEVWRKKAGAQITPYLEKSKAMLVKAGIPEDRISIKVVEGSQSPANDIIQEAKTASFGTIVLGRRGISMLKELLMGSVTNRVLQQSDGFAVWIAQ
ncbi:MAG: universal stress protein [Proteobacteria bacterium]|nr:universal stress protein [Pseudomonadota bacterium]